MMVKVTGTMKWFQIVWFTAEIWVWFNLLWFLRWILWLAIIPTSLGNPAILSPIWRTTMAGLVAWDYSRLPHQWRVAGPLDFLNMTTCWLVVCVVWVFFVVIPSPVDFVGIYGVGSCYCSRRHCYNFSRPGPFLWERGWILNRGKSWIGSHWSLIVWYTTCGTLRPIALTLTLAS